jgi:crotonobetainyl-CoA:carnitine CoA-transferase CaiB-like acyl-CoA transferase
VLVVDASRMLPGAVLARSLLDLGARLIKVEDPRGGDVLRSAPPLVDGIGIGFCTFFRGAESVALDLRTERGRTGLDLLLGRADVFIESFRPGTLARWGVDLDAAEAKNPGLISCSLPSFAENVADEVAHDLNIMGLTGVLEHLPNGDGGIPRLQFVDVNTGLLANSSILAALLRRGRDGRGGRLSQPMACAPLPWLTWAWADQALGGDPGMSETLLSGKAACYRTYRCRDGDLLSVACVEPKFWVTFTQVIELPALATRGFDTTPAGAEVAAAVSERLATRPRAEWLALLEPHRLPIAAVQSLAQARADPRLDSSPLVERLPLPDGSSLRAPGPALPSLGRTPERPAPRLGAHTEAVLEEMGGQ